MLVKVCNPNGAPVYFSYTGQDSICMSTIIFNTLGSSPKVSRVHSETMSCEDRFGSQAKRPNAYRFACARSNPSQLVSRPTLETPTNPPSRRLKVLPETICATDVLPSPCKSKSRISFYVGARKHNCRCCPVYSWVICNSKIWFVCCNAPIKGDTGSRA